MDMIRRCFFLSIRTGGILFYETESFHIRHSKKWGLSLLTDILGGMLIAVGTYNFAAMAHFPMAGLNGIALIFTICSGFPSDAWSCS